MVSVILDNLAKELTLDETVTDYPPLILIDIRAAIAHSILHSSLPDTSAILDNSTGKLDL